MFRIRMIAVGVWAFLLVALASAQLPFTDSSIELTAPKAGAVYHVGDKITVHWVLHNKAVPGGGVAVLISPDDGLNWIVLITKMILRDDTTAYHDSTGTFVWTVVDSAVLYGSVYLQLKTNTCRMRVGAPYDEVFAPSESGTFTIAEPAPPAEPAKKSGCGSGFGLALIPPIAFKWMRPKKKPAKNA
jgi:hypothetical protein